MQDRAIMEDDLLNLTRALETIKYLGQFETQGLIVIKDSLIESFNELLDKCTQSVFGFELSHIYKLVEETPNMGEGMLKSEMEDICQKILEN